MAFSLSLRTLPEVLTFLQHIKLKKQVVCLFYSVILSLQQPYSRFKAGWEDCRIKVNGSIVCAVKE